MMRSKILHLVGGGVSPALHFTRQASQLAAAADCLVYYSDPALEAIFDEIGVRKRVTLDDLYPDGGVDDDSYDAVLKRILELLETHAYVVFVQQGNPRLGVTLADMLLEASEKHGFDFDIFPGVSSLDSLMIDTDRDPLEYGSVIIDANRLLLFSHQMLPELDYYIYHICSVGTRKTNVDDPATDNNVDLLQAHLLEAFPPDHVCKIVESRGDGVESAIVTTLKISEIAEAVSVITFGSTLFIPAVGRPPVNPRVLKMLMAQ